MRSGKPRRQARSWIVSSGHLVVRLGVWGGLVWFAGFVYLLVFGVPDFIVDKIEQHVHPLGLTLEVERIALSFKGWIVSGVSCREEGESSDSEPLVRVQSALIRRVRMGEGCIVGRGYFLEAEGIAFSPSESWGIEVPSDSFARRVQRVECKLGRGPDCFVVEEGKIDWHGIDVLVGGRGMNLARGRQGGVPGFVREALPVFAGPEVHGVAELVFDSFANSRAPRIEVDFLFDGLRSDKTRVGLSVSASDLHVAAARFSHVNIEAEYADHRFLLSRAMFFEGEKSCVAKGEVHSRSHDAWLWIENDISSPSMLSLLPDGIRDLMDEHGVRGIQLPRFELSFGPVDYHYLTRRVSGTFSQGEIEVEGLVLDRIQGELSRTGARLDLFNLKGNVVGQQERAADSGSCMVGGAVDGSFFWDPETEWFGLSANGQLDPLLLIDPLSKVAVATNVISRFGFDSEPPRGHIELGVCYNDWDSFYFDVQGSAKAMRFHDVPFSSVVATARYASRVLTMDRFVATQGSNYVQGMVSFDFGNGVAAFKGDGVIDPYTLERIVFPGGDVFHKRVKVAGGATMEGQGVVDWRSMQATDFVVQVAAPRVDLPFAMLDDLKTVVSAQGPKVDVSDATFGFYGGKGSGSLSMVIDPAHEGIPARIDVRVDDADFEQCLAYMKPENPAKARGVLSGLLRADTDLSLDFFKVANGRGEVRVREGQLTDLPLFRAFSLVIRKVVPSFSVFSINALSADFELKNGVVWSQNAYFDGYLLSAKGRGSYTVDKGFDAYVQAQMLSEGVWSSLLRMVTDPIFKLLELKLEGTMEDPSWQLSGVPIPGWSAITGQ